MPRSLQQTGVERRKKPSARKRKIRKPPAEAIIETESPEEAVTDGIVAAMGDGASVPEDGTSIVSIIRGLEGQVDTAFKLKKVVEADLVVTQKRLSEELAVRAELEARVEALEPRAARVDRLREDIAFTEQERDKFANSLAETRQQLEAVTAQRDSLVEERDSLIEEVASVKAHAEELEGEKTAFEAQVLNLTDKVEDLDRLRGELAETTEARRDLGKQIRDLSSRLDAAETSNSDLKSDLAEAREAVRGLREEVEDLRQRLAAADSEVTIYAFSSRSSKLPTRISWRSRHAWRAT